MVLFVDEAESVARQLKRGRHVVAHNEEVTRSGVGERWEERATDFSEELARSRYRVFKEQTYDALVSQSRSSTTTPYSAFRGLTACPSVILGAPMASTLSTCSSDAISCSQFTGRLRSGRSLVHF
jgi:hypothetical protein